MDFRDDPADMMPGRRFREIAGILAAGYLRLRKHHPQLAQDPSDPADKRLDCSSETSPPLAGESTEKEGRG